MDDLVLLLLINSPANWSATRSTKLFVSLCFLVTIVLPSFTSTYRTCSLLTRADARAFTIFSFTLFIVAAAFFVSSTRLDDTSNDLVALSPTHDASESNI